MQEPRRHRGRGCAYEQDRTSGGVVDAESGEMTVHRLPG